MDVIRLLGSTMGLGLLSGLNLYGTVLTVGLGLRLGLIHLRPELQQLEVLANPFVITVAGAIFLIEFLADKVKWIDSIWDAVHTLIRPLGAIIIGATAVGEVNPEMVVVAALCGGVALSGHSAKAGLRLLANHSPEPFSNIALSLIEDGIVVVGSWFALQYPNLMLLIVIVFMIAFLWLTPKIFRLVRIEMVAIFAIFKKLLAIIKRYIFFRRRTIVTADSNIDFPVGDSSPERGSPLIGHLNDELPVTYIYYLRDKLKLDERQPRIRCVAGKGIKGLRHSIGYLTFTPDQLVFVSRRLFRFRNHKIARNRIDHVHFKKHLLLDRLNIRAEKKHLSFYFFKDISNRGETIHNILSADGKTES